MNIIDLPSPSVIMITSSLFGKCHFNRKLWLEVTHSEVELIEINLAEERNRSILEHLDPLMAPTIYVNNKNRTEFVYEVVLNSETVKSIIKICNILISQN